MVIVLQEWMTARWSRPAELSMGMEKAMFIGFYQQEQTTAFECGSCVINKIDFIKKQVKATWKKRWKKSDYKQFGLWDQLDLENLHFMVCVACTLMITVIWLIFRFQNHILLLFPKVKATCPYRTNSNSIVNRPLLTSVIWYLQYAPFLSLLSVAICTKKLI